MPKKKVKVKGGALGKAKRALKARPSRIEAAERKALGKKKK